MQCCLTSYAFLVVDKCCSAGQAATYFSKWAAKKRDVKILTCFLVFVLVSAGIELIFLPIAAVFWIWYKKNVDNTDVFSYCYAIKDFFQFPMFSWWAGVQELGGSTARQIAKLAKGNIPYHGRHAQFMNGGSPGRRSSPFLRVRTFLWVQSVFRSFAQFTKSASSVFRDRCPGTGYATGRRAVRKKIVLYIIWVAYSLLLLLVIVVFSFVVLLNCLYLSPQVLLFVHSPPHPAVGEGVSERLSGPSCWLPG